VFERYHDGAAFADLGLGRQGEIRACGEGDDGGIREAAAVLVVAERAGFQDAVHLLDIGNGGIAEIDVGFLPALGEGGCIVIDVVEVVLAVLLAMDSLIRDRMRDKP
jgi:hypothetical protein